MNTATLDPDRQPGAPTLRAPTAETLSRALALGWQDFRRAPRFGLMAGAACALAGWALAGLTLAAGHTFWLILAVFGFPLIAPFAAIGTYEVSRLLERDAAPRMRDVLAVLWAERHRQLPWLCAMMVVALLFWFFLGHMIFALFLGLAPMTNVMSSLQVFLTPNGLTMLAVGSAVGGIFALVLYAICVMGLPMLLDREVDPITAMLRSIALVRDHPAVMLGWAFIVAALVFVAMIPAFLGLIVVLPWLGHASWRLYRLVAAPDA